MRLLLAALVFGWSLAAAAEERFQFKGTVTGPGGPLPGAQLRVQSHSTSETVLTAITNAAGGFALDVREGLFNLTITPPAGSGLATEEMFNIELREPLEGRFELRRAFVVAGRCPFPAQNRHPRARLYSLSTARTYDLSFDQNGSFEQQVVADHYSIQCWAFVASDFWFGRVNVDVTSADSRSVRVNLEANPSVITKTPPRAALISIGAAGADGVADIVGVAGAVEPLSSVVAGNLNTEQAAITVARADGSFATRMFAPPGSFIQVKHDPTGRYLPQIGFNNGTINGLSLPPGTILHVPPPANTFATGGLMNYGAARSGRRDFEGLARFGAQDPGQWWVTGTYDKTTLVPGARITLRGTITLYSRNITAALDITEGRVNIGGDVELQRLFDENGAAHKANQQFLSSWMTPTGLPVERVGYNGIGQTRITSLRHADPNRIEAEWSFEGNVPPNARPGLYVPRIQANFSGIPIAARHFGIFAAVESGPDRGSSLPPVRIGTPSSPRLYWMLGLDDLVNGLRGGVAVEDRGKFQIASHVTISSDALILPPRDERTGALIRYRLEPFVPMIATSTARLTDPPLIPFRFPSGSLTVRVQKPDGTIDDLGSAPFAQSTSRMPASRTGESIGGASSSVSDYYQLTTLDPRFEYTFTRYGRHVVTMSGWIEDAWGNRYEGGGTYEVFAARPLDIETAVLPGTPFFVGSDLASVVVVQPPVPAEVELVVRHLPDSDPLRAIRYEVRGRANRYGFAHLSTDAVRFDTPGEYRLDLVARHVDADGTWWMGTATWGNVVETPDSPLRTKGRRGFDGVNAIQQQWFLVREARAGGDHVMFPFHAGDVMWMQKDDPAADIPKITIQDTQGAFAARVRNRHGSFEPPTMDQRITAGEIPLFSWSSSVNDVSSAPELTEQWAYFYAYAERPGVRVREFVSEDLSGNGYWRFSDNYHFQLGNGANGDQPNDFKFQFGGSVFRDDTDGFRYYGAYGSFFVLLPLQDEVGGRVMPPFQGNGGGPDGGPLFTLKGKGIDLFFHPTGLRPGTILQRGHRASFAGYSAPTLPSKIEIVVTSPSGATRTIRGQANTIGYFYDPSQDFAVGESGIWKAKVKIVFDGRTSAGPVTAPFPAGDVLGSRDGEFFFYVVDASAPQLDLAAMPQFVRPADGPITFTVNRPSGLSNLQLTYTTTMPGFILEEKVQTSMNVVYDATKMASDFPNLDLYDLDGYAGVDTITLSLLLSGTDAQGKRQHLARQIVLQGEELQMPEQPPRPSRRRAVR